ncbi:MAG TPA: hydantoinase/oxoprolinase family protein [Terriglobia bacterium]|nr:hydantoinase/oxoprolinase family protein [Terriglobia bacterium]
MRVAVDTGGTFTDCVVLEGSRIKILKVFSTPDDSALGILEGVHRIACAMPRDSTLDVIHGTTVGTNSLLERRGARVALVTTAGFEDLIEIGRQNRPRLYDLNVGREPPLVPRPMRWGVLERTTASGEILLRPRLGDLQRLTGLIRRAGAESIAICFLFSFRNAENEKKVSAALRKLGLPVSMSQEILPEFREYERLSTVVINAYLAPRLGSYLARLGLKVEQEFSGAGALTDTGLRTKPRSPNPPASKVRIYVMQSNGGITTADRASREPVRTILSGPAGGVVASARLAQTLGIARAMSFDMGGTSTDVCLLDGPPRTTHETTLAGLPVAVPVLDVHSVGAGGGSLARVDAGGALRVGPESAGAVPGPICYGRGGTQPTVTDAHLLLGRLDLDHFLGRSFRLDLGAVQKRFTDFLRTLPRNLRAISPKSPLALASGMIAVSNATMERALRLISVERGYDPRDFTLICFGGAGGLHAADLARSLELRAVIVPMHPGTFSALGILLSDIVKEASQSVLLPVPEAGLGARSSRRQFHAFYNSLARRFESIKRKGLAELNHERFNTKRARAECRLACRYVGQAYELSVPFSRDFRRRFHSRHERAYGHAQPTQSMEIVSLQVRLTLPTPKPGSGARGNRSLHGIRQARVKIKPVWFDHHIYQTILYDREKLGPGMKITGPAIVVEYSSTTVIPPDFACTVDEHLNLRLTRYAH